jgi:hypothetical protein
LFVGRKSACVRTPRKSAFNWTASDCAIDIFVIYLYIFVIYLDIFVIYLDIFVIYLDIFVIYLDIF